MKYNFTVYTLINFNSTFILLFLYCLVYMKYIFLNLNVVLDILLLSIIKKY